MIRDKNSIDVLRELLIFLFVSISAILVFSILGTGLTILFSKLSGSTIDPAQMQNANGDAIIWVKVTDVILRIGILGVPAFLVPYLLKQKPSAFLQIRNHFNWIAIFRFLLLMIILFPFLEWLIGINMKMDLPAIFDSAEQWMREKEDSNNKLLKKFLETDTLGGLLFNIFVIGVMPAIFEELFFRGLLQNLLHRWFSKANLAILITAFFFSAIHLQFFGFLPRFLLGILLGYFYFWTRNLWVPIAVHFIYNSITIIFVYLAGKDIINYNIEEPMNTQNIVIIISLAISAAFFIFLAMYYSKKRDKSKDWTKVFTANKPSKAEIIKGMLVNENIDAVVLNKRDSVYPSHGPVEVYVKPGDEDKALELIQKYRKDLLDEEEKDIVTDA